MSDLGKKIAHYRVARGLTQADLARLSGVSQPTIFALESGQQRTARKLLDIAAALNVSASDLDPRFSSSVTVDGQSIPVYGTAEGGEGVLLIEKTAIDYMPRPANAINAPEAYAVYIAGESMVPEFFPGERAVVNPHLPIVSNEVYIFYTDDGQDDRAAIKRLVRQNKESWTVLQWNPEKEFDMPKAVWQKAHRVVAKFTR